MPRAAPTGASRRSIPPPASPARPIPVDDPYNMYFTPDGKSAIVVAEALQAAGLPRSPDHGAAVVAAHVPSCAGINHADFSIDGRFRHLHLRVQAAAGQDRSGRAARCWATSSCSKGRMPQDVRAVPDGKIFYVAELQSGGVLPGGRRDLHRGGLHRHRRGDARAVPEPGRQEALRHQPGNGTVYGGRRGARAAWP